MNAVFYASSSQNRAASRKIGAFFKASAISLALLCALNECVDDMSACGPNSLYAQDIITDSSNSINRFSGFSTQTTNNSASGSLYAARPTDATGSLLDSERVALDLSAPQNAPKQIDALSYRIPFVFPQGADQESATSVELFCSDDQGKTWASYATINAGENKNAFLFEAPAPGEYWFVLKTYFQNEKIAYSSTRAYHFGEKEQEEFLLADPELDDLTLLDEPQAPQALLEAEDSDDTLYVDQTSAQDDAFALNSDANDEQEKIASNNEEKVVPYPGKIKAITLGKEEGTDKLMIMVRWFRPEDLEEQYRVGTSEIEIHRGPSESGPWTIVGQKLSPEQNGYGWVATEEEMKPFYVRVVVVDENGATKKEVSPAAVDVASVDLKGLLGYVRTPVPLTKKTARENNEEKKHSAKKTSSKNDELSLIQTTSSSDEKEETESEEERKEKEADLENLERESKALKTPELTSTVEKTQKKYAPPKERPIVPAPTNPNRMEFNPLFTRGVGVLYRSAQTRHAQSSTTTKRSIFTPPSQAARASSAPPAEYRRSQAQIAALEAKRARERMAEEAKYMRERELESFEKNPELMEGRVFYMDANGNLTTTPPAEFLQAQNNWQITNVGEPITVGNMSEDPNSIYMPQNTDEYDASARSGAAIMQSDPYTQGAGSGSSPLNQRYAPTENRTTPIPQTSYSTSRSPATIPYNFPPQPMVGN